MSMTIDADILLHKLAEEFEQCYEEFAEDEPGEIDENVIFRGWLLCKLASLMESLADLKYQVGCIQAELLQQETGLDIETVIGTMAGITQSPDGTNGGQTSDYAFTHLDGTSQSNDDMSKVVSNPVLAGIGPYRGIISDRVWVKANAANVIHEGAECAIKRILSIYAEAFPILEPPDAIPYIERIDGDPTPVLQSLLGELRAIFNEGIQPERVSAR